MEKININYNLYDSVDNTAAYWLAWNLQQKGKIGFTSINGFDDEDLWLMSIAKHIYIYSEKPFYVDCSFLDYLWLKYIKKFKFIKYYWQKKNEDVFLIDAIDFIKEITIVCNVNVETIVKIYNTYYRR